MFSLSSYAQFLCVLVECLEMTCLITTHYMTRFWSRWVKELPGTPDTFSSRVTLLNYSDIEVSNPGMTVSDMNIQDHSKDEILMSLIGRIYHKNFHNAHDSSKAFRQVSCSFNFVSCTHNNWHVGTFLCDCFKVDYYTTERHSYSSSLRCRQASQLSANILLPGATCFPMLIHPVCRSDTLLSDQNFVVPLQVSGFWQDYPYCV